MLSPVRPATTRPLLLAGLLVIAATTEARAGGLDPNHRWDIGIKGNWLAVSEYDRYPPTTGVFTRVQITASLTAGRRTFGRDFPCRFEFFWSVAALVPSFFLFSLVYLVTRRRRRSGADP